MKPFCEIEISKKSHTVPKNLDLSLIEDDFVATSTGLEKNGEKQL